MISIKASKEELLQRLERKSIRLRGCWLWTGACNKGHGVIRIEGRNIATHRLSAYIHWGFDLNSPMMVLHKLCCSNPNCIDPEHLYEGTAQDNMIDAVLCGTHVSVERMARTHCPQGHEYNEENTYIYHGNKQCKICSRERHKKRYHEQRKGESQ